MNVAISGAAKPKTANDLLEVLLGIEMQAGVTAWYQRVPSPSNMRTSPRESCAANSVLMPENLLFRGYKEFQGTLEKLHVGQIGVDRSTSRDHPAFLWQVIACIVIGDRCLQMI